MSSFSHARQALSPAHRQSSVQPRPPDSPLQPLGVDLEGHPEQVSLGHPPPLLLQLQHGCLDRQVLHGQVALCGAQVALLRGWAEERDTQHSCEHCRAATLDNQAACREQPHACRPMPSACWLTRCPRGSASGSEVMSSKMPRLLRQANQVAGRPGGG